MDVLSEIINSSGLKGYMITRDTFFRNWGYKFPCNQSFGFHIITRGNCYIRYKKKIEKLEKGDIVFISRGFDHELVSSTNQKALDIKSLPEEYFKPGKEKEEPIVTLLSIRYEIQEMIHPFFFELPDIIIVKENNIPSHHPIHSALVLISNEMAIGENSELVLQKLADVLLYYILKFWVDREETGAPGWIKTFKDEKILYALDILHKDLSKDWTLDSISESIGISRASLATRFKESLGITVGEYLTRTRVEKGRKMLKEKDKNLEEVARKLGYSNAFSFSKAYKRIRGVSPSIDLKTSINR